MGPRWKRWLAACWLTLGVTMTGQSLAEEIMGTFDIRDERPVVVADRMYLVTDMTQLFDLQDQQLSRGDLPPGREVIVDSATLGTAGNMPIATRLIVLPPH